MNGIFIKVQYIRRYNLFAGNYHKADGELRKSLSLKKLISEKTAQIVFQKRFQFFHKMNNQSVPKIQSRFSS